MVDASRITNAVVQKQALEDSLRAAMIRTAYSDANLSPLPEDCTFTLAIEMRDDARPGKVPSQREWKVNEVGDDCAVDSGGTTTPTRGEAYVYWWEYDPDSEY